MVGGLGCWGWMRLWGRAATVYCGFRGEGVVEGFGILIP